MDHAAILEQLAQGEFTLEGQFTRGSNYTFLGNIATESGPMKVVYKPTRGEIPLWDFPARTLAKREVAAYLTSRVHGLGIDSPHPVPKKGLPFGPGMLQFYIEHDPNYHVFTFTPKTAPGWIEIVAFDLLINNGDRKGSHVLVGEDGHLWCIDHGVSFHTEDKLRTVIWDFAGQPISGDILDTLENLVSRKPELLLTLKPYLRVSEVNAILRRANEMLQSKTYRIPSDERRMYPYPPV